MSKCRVKTNVSWTAMDELFALLPSSPFFSPGIAAGPDASDACNLAFIFKRACVAGLLTNRILSSHQTRLPGFTTVSDDYTRVLE